MVYYYHLLPKVRKYSLYCPVLLYRGSVVLLKGIVSIVTKLTAAGILSKVVN